MAQLLIHNREHLAIKIQQIQQLQPNITVAPANLFRLAARMVLMVEVPDQSRVLKETPHTTLKDPTETPSLGLVTIHIIMVLQVAPNIMVLMVGSAGSVTGPQGNTAYYAQGPGGNTVAGIHASQIPPGQEDLYILKTQVVPPVCPVCPVASATARTEPAPPCPACARCPEPSFDCKKVPNYNAINSNLLPTPVLNDFSTFGM